LKKLSLMKISFHGAAGTVTGSKHLLTLKDGRKLLLDCGMFQGHGIEAEALNRHWGFEPESIDYLILSHAHIDHSGLIPKFVKDGFKGKIFATPATYDLCEIMLYDSAHIQEDDVYYLNKRRQAKGKKLLEPLYEPKDVQQALNKFHLVNYETPYKIDNGIELLFTDSGHILGSAAVNLTIHDFHNKFKICFTGDIGRYNNKILKDPQPFPQADYIICESTYGDLLHETNTLTEKKLLQIVEHTCIEKKGKLIIPAFSVGRTQEIVNMLNNIQFEKLLPRTNVFVDSPLSTDATEIYQKHTNCFNDEVIEYIKKDPTPFGFHRLHYITKAEDSKKLNFLKEPCIIISASGMMEAGRIKHHLANNISDASNTILIVGWCAPGTLGRKILRGDSIVKIFGEEYQVKADIVVMNEFSAHGDYNEMLQYLSCQKAQHIKQIFLVHGDDDVLPDWKMKLTNAGYTNIVIPQLHESFEIK
jgi:metallo-beta-lactamase family protein